MSGRERLYRQVSPNQFVRQLAAQVVRSVVEIVGLGVESQQVVLGESEAADGRF
ncbi:MAG: hypothetical protein ACK4QW_05885 [Alphaproteobacteria bacterium]